MLRAKDKSVKMKVLDLIRILVSGYGDSFKLYSSIVTESLLEIFGRSRNCDVLFGDIQSVLQLFLEHGVIKAGEYLDGILNYIQLIIYKLVLN